MFVGWAGRASLPSLSEIGVAPLQRAPSQRPVHRGIVLGNPSPTQITPQRHRFACAPGPCWHRAPVLVFQPLRSSSCSPYRRSSARSRRSWRSRSLRGRRCGRPLSDRQSSTMRLRPVVAPREAVLPSAGASATSKFGYRRARGPLGDHAGRRTTLAQLIVHQPAVGLIEPLHEQRRGLRFRCQQLRQLEGRGGRPPGRSAGSGWSSSLIGCIGRGCCLQTGRRKVGQGRDRGSARASRSADQFSPRKLSKRRQLGRP